MNETTEAPKLIPGSSVENPLEIVMRSMTPEECVSNEYENIMDAKKAIGKNTVYVNLGNKEMGVLEILFDDKDVFDPIKVNLPNFDPEGASQEEKDKLIAIYKRSFSVAIKCTRNRIHKKS